MYLKLLHAIASGSAPRGHGLEELFSSLPQTIQSAVTDAYGDSGLPSHIQAASDAFIQWRYQHEHKALTLNLTALMAVSKACHRVVRQLRPELEVFGENDVFSEAEQV